jgi:hypothetical protein
MKKRHQPRRVMLLITGAVCIFLPLILSGCSKEEPPAASTGYYSGPMKSKNDKTGGKAGTMQ